MLSMFLFGVSYAVASLSCTIGPFLAVTSTTFRNENYLSGVFVFVLYGLGMGLVVSVLTMAVALAKDGLVSRFRSLLPVMNKVAGVSCWWSPACTWRTTATTRSACSSSTATSTTRSSVFAEDIQTWLVNRMPDTDNYPAYLIGGLVVLAAGRCAVVVEPQPTRPGGRCLGLCYKRRSCRASTTTAG